MKSPVLDKRHLKEYLLYGGIAAIVYMIPVASFLSNNTYQHLYYLFIGCGLFMAAMFFYCYKLLYSRYDKRRAVSMLLAGHLATVTGVIISCLLVIVAMLLFKLDPFSTQPSSNILPGAAAQVQQGTPSSLLLMIYLTSIIGNFATGSFITVVVSYAGKLDQTKDKPVDIAQH